MVDATLRFLTDTTFRDETRRRAYQYAKPMFWPNVGRRYLEFFTRVGSASETTVPPLYCRASATLSGEREPAKLMQKCSVMHVGDQN
jgi:hypothetical protein